MIAQPPVYSDPNALSTGYCAFHDYTYPNVESGIYNGVQQGIAYTNMPYALAVNSGSSNACGENAALGGWYDTVDANENGDKCAWVGEPLNAIIGLPTHPGQPTVTPIPGALGDIKGHQGTTFAVQSLWSNQSAAGLGYCAGAGTDLPTG